jgi:hypothetical protein
MRCTFPANCMLAETALAATRPISAVAFENFTMYDVKKAVAG